jgi:hypothetical protein
MPLYAVQWKNNKRSGLSTADADSEQAAGTQVSAAIASKYYWQGPCKITSVALAKGQQPVTEQQQHEETPATPEKYAFAYLWHPKAPVKVSIPIPVTAGLSSDDCTRLLASVDNLLAAGWLANLAGTEPGEESEEVGAVLRRTVDSRTHPSGECPYMALYSPNEGMEYAFFSMYLNTEEDIELFTAVTGLNPLNIENFAGAAAPKRGDKRTDKFIVKIPKAARIVLKPNPHYDAEKAAEAKAKDVAYKVPKRVFVRWLDAPPPAAEPAPAASKLPTSANANAQSGGKSWANSTPAERCQAIMGMTDLMKLLEVKRFADKTPIDEATTYHRTVTLRVFQIFQLSLSEAASDMAIKDIMDSVKSENFGKFNEQQTRDLNRVADTRKQFLKTAK